jgi:hypothetical protein
MQPRTDLALRVDNALPGYGRFRLMVPQGCHRIPDLARRCLFTYHRGDLPIGRDAPGWNLPHDLIDALEKSV